jgi:hypothetical protein
VATLRSVLTYIGEFICLLGFFAVMYILLLATG